MLNVRLALAAAHLLDSGHSLVGLRRWLGEHSQCSAVDLLVQVPANSRTKVPGVQYLGTSERSSRNRPLRRIPCPNFTSRWSTGSDRRQVESLDSIPALGAFNYTVEARDAERAVRLVSGYRADASRARFAIRTVTSCLEVHVETEDRSLSYAFRTAMPQSCLW